MKLLLGLTFILLSFSTFAESGMDLVDNDEINIFIMSQPKVKKLLEEQSKKHACEKQFGEFSPRSKSGLVEVREELKSCLKDLKCEEIVIGHFIPTIPRSLIKEAIVEVDKEIATFPKNIEDTMDAQAECSSSFNKRGVGVTVGFDKAGKMTLLKAVKY